MNTKEKFLKYISDNYDYLNSQLKKMNINNDDIINELYLYFYNKDEINDSIIDNNKELAYFITSAKYYTYSLYKKNKKIDDYKQKYKSDIIEFDNKNNDLYLIILELLEKLYKDNDIKWYDYQLFKIYYYSEYIYDISKYTKEEVDKLRKISLRSLQKKIKINYVSISNSLTKTKNILINNLNINI